MRIILADDHPLYRTGMKQLLSGLFPEATIDEAGDASALDAQISATPDPDLIISDLLFPGFDYMRDLKRLRQNLFPLPDHCGFDDERPHRGGPYHGAGRKWLCLQVRPFRANARSGGERHGGQYRGPPE